MSFTDRTRQLSSLVIFGLLLLLTACGGGGSGSASTAQGNTTVQPAGSEAQTDSAESSVSIPVSSGDQSSSSGSLPNPPSPQLQEITLQWQSPSTRSDGSPLSLSEIAGYNIYYSQQPGQFSNSVYVKGGYKMQVTIEGLASGRYYLTMTTIDDLGLESNFSSQLVVEI